MSKQKKEPKDPSVKILTPDKENTVKIIIEVVVKQEKSESAPIKALLPDASGGGECPSNKFTYSFSTKNSTVLAMTVEGVTLKNPGENGEFTACVNDASPKPKIMVSALAKSTGPGATASLSMTLNGKTISIDPDDFSDPSDNGLMVLDTKPTLPQ